MLDIDDHRNLAQRLDLFHFQDEAPGMVFWHPNGFRLVRLLEEAVRAEIRQQGYAEIRSPQLLRKSVWEASGHWRHFYDGMFRLEDQAEPAALKPVSCPGHIFVARHGAPSYRDLPLRLAELGVVHRDEAAGALHGLLRLRQFCQDDGHVFCAREQASAEVERFCRRIRPFYAQFGFEAVRFVLSLRPDDRAGDDASWDRSEALLDAALRQIGEPFELLPGGGAFYGPKIEIWLADRRGRDWQCGTIQLDLVMPRSFELEYVDANGERRPVVMLHRALYGSVERFLGILLEHHGARLPFWLAPRHVVVLPIGQSELAWAESAARRLARAGLVVDVDARDSLARRIARAHERAVPVMAVVGAREARAQSVSLRDGQGQRELPLEQAAEELAARARPPWEAR